MFRCDLSLDLKGQWRLSHLFTHLEHILAKQNAYFDEKHPFPGDLETESDKEVNRAEDNCESITME